MRVLLSVKPEFIEKIFVGKKLYEFRTRIFRRSDIKTIVLYASSPVQKVVGEIEIDKIIGDDKDQLWKLTKHYSGISKKYYDEYFKDKDYAYAIKIKSAKKYKTQLPLKKDYNIQYAPQSFVYL